MDTIDREAALKAVHEAIAEGKSWYSALSHLPSAEKTGKWQYVDYGGFGNYHCTACGKICICNGGYDYCPNCGARMVE